MQPTSRRTSRSLGQPGCCSSSRSRGHSASCGETVLPPRHAGEEVGAADPQERHREPCNQGSAQPKRVRSEEHTSELQSRLHLVCRLLLEKKKKKNTHTMTCTT